ncbi:1-acyl-sn-glycerol-3-phosphate acyltransferase alpha isoform X2 [Nomia melanderi]|uniref:1-acyl-sn-glycerol-3-phosphate acyltransferase alpha isoform X2 n=1 Tax=Nomia melanderi TaxID=2448451 RepID=UPI0013042D4F|nr:1-acyl-sn-glycerol-3-phosphate acyltransferase alpha [Nomia melanderi]
MLQTVTYYSIALIGGLTVLAFIVSCERVRYHIKFSFFIAILGTLPSLYIPFMLLRVKDWRNAIPVVWTIKLCAKLMGVTFHIRGKENLVQDSGSIILINHQSILDIAVVSDLWLMNRRCAVIAKKEILFFGSFGIAAWLWGTIFISRQKSKEAHNIMNNTAQIIKDTKTNLFIFPEGSRHSNPKLLPFKKGAFHIAIATQFPIQPVVVSKYYFLNSKWKIFNSGISCVTILPPIPTEGLNKDDLPLLVEKVYECMNSEFIKTSQEILGEHINSFKAN